MTEKLNGNFKTMLARASAMVEDDDVLGMVIVLIPKSNRTMPMASAVGIFNLSELDLVFGAMLHEMEGQSVGSPMSARVTRH